MLATSKPRTRYRLGGIATERQQAHHRIYHIYQSSRHLDAFASPGEGRREMLLIRLVIVLLLSIGAYPAWPQSRNWGYYRSGGIGLVMVILLVLLLMGRL
jgi:uncharacterized protein DUF3309